MVWGREIPAVGDGSLDESLSLSALCSAGWGGPVADFRGGARVWWRFLGRGQRRLCEWRSVISAGDRVVGVLRLDRTILA